MPNKSERGQRSRKYERERGGRERGVRRRGERRERDGRGRQRNLFSEESSQLFLEKTPVEFPDQ